MNFLHDTLCNLRLTLIQSYLLQKRCTIIDRESADLSNALPTESYSQYFRLESCPLACRTWCLTHICLVLITAVIAISLTMAAMDKGNYAFKACGVITHSAITVLVFNVNFIIKAIDDRFLGFNRKLLPWVIHREFQFSC